MSYSYMDLVIVQQYVRREKSALLALHHQLLLAVVTSGA